MAEETKEKQEKKNSTYKFGQSELDLNSYIQTLGHNLNNYLDTVKKDWTEEQRQEFTTAYDRYITGLKEQRDSGVERFSSTDYGRILDSQGKLSNKDDDDIDPAGSEYYYNDKGERITTDDYNLLSDKKKKKYKTFSANREVATYFKTIAEALKSEMDKKATKTETSNIFDITKHGYIPYHSSRYNPTGGTWDGQSILDLDPYDETTGKRGTSQRTARLASDLDQYLKEMDSTIDFSKTRWKTREGYENFIRGTIGKINDGLTSQDYLDLAEAGLTREFLEPYITTEKSLMTKAQRDAADAKAKAEADAKTLEDQNKAYQEMMAERLRIYDANKGLYDENNPYFIGKPTYYDLTTNTFDKEGYDEAIQMGNSPSLYTNGKFIGYDNILNNLFSNNEEMFLPNNRDLNRALLSYILKLGTMHPISDGTYKGWYYLPWEKDKQLNRATIYNPNTGEMQRVFIGYIPEERAKIDNKWKLDNGITQRIDDFKLYRDGGSINYMQLGGGVSMDDLDRQYRKQALKERANAAGVSVEKQKAGERKTSSSALSPDNPNAGWSATDTARIISSLADIGAMGASFGGPVGSLISAGLGVGSSLISFGADVAEDGLDWGDASNLVMNLGFDVLGAIPGGGAASKSMKIAKTLGKYASRAMASIAVMNGVANADNIIKSLGKLTTDPKNLTVNDWRYIAQGFGLLTGGIAAGTRKYKKSVMEADMKAKANGAIAVEIVDKTGNNKKIIAFSGDDAKAIKQAQESGDLKALREATVGKYEQFKDWDLSTTGNVGFRSARGTDGWQLPWGAKEGRARVFDMYGDNHGNLFTKGGNWSADVKTGRPIDPATELTTATVDAALKDNRTKALDQLRDISRRRKIGADNAKKRIKDTDDAFTAEIKTKKDALDAANAAGEPGAITTAQNAYDDALMRQTDWQARRARLQSFINDFNTGKVYDSWKSKYLQGTGDDAKLIISDPRYTRKEELVFKDILQNLGITPHNFKYEKGGRIKALARFLDSQIIKAQNGTVMLRNNQRLNIDNSENNARNTKLWNNYYKMDDILNDLESNLSNKDANTFATILNELNNLGADFTNPILNKKGYLNWNTKYDTTGLNKYFGSDSSRFDYLGPSTWNRNLLLKQIQEKFSTSGLSVGGSKIYFDGNNWTTSKPVQPAERTTPVTSTQSIKRTAPVTPAVTTGTDILGSKKEDTPLKPEKKKFSWEMDPTMKFGLPRALYADIMNRRITDLMKESPVLQNPFEYHRTVKSDLNAEMQGQRSAATLANMASKPMTSDASLQVATQLEAANKGQEFINKGMEASNLAYRQSAELAWQQEKENAKNRNAIAGINNAAMAATDSNNRKHEAAYLSKKATIWDTFAKQLEYDAKTEQLEKKAEQNALVKSDIRKQVLDEVLSENSAAKYGLLPSHVEVLQKLNSGETLSDEQKKLAFEANKIIEELITGRYADWRGLKRYYTGVPKITSAQTTTFTPTVVPGEKKGGKIEIAGIKARTADAERFQKLIIESIRRNEKSLDRLSKSMVNYVKDIMK